MDVLTLGLWEVVGTPIEAVAGAEEHDRYVIYYDQEDQIDTIQRIHVESQPIDEDANLKQKESYPIDHSQ
ncbi:MAG: hypothetical protein WD000_05305 [Thermodesulfobacteriota bacterium]